MHVYIDYILIENFILDLLIIWQTEVLVKRKINIKRRMLAAILSSAYVCIMICLQIRLLDSLFLKLLLSFGVVFVAFNPKRLNEYIKEIAVFYLSTVINAGTTVLVEQMINVDMSKIILKLIVYSISLTLSYIFTKQLWKIYKNNINEKSLIYKVELEIEGNKYWYKGFVDTGNTARSIELNAPIVFAEYLDEEQKRKIEKTQKSQIEICTISSINYLDAIKVKKAKIEGKTIELGIVFVENKLDRKNQYNMVLNYHIFEEVLGGISI